MAHDESNKTHVLLVDCIISEFGRCEAGHMLSETDVHGSTWNWLIQQGYLKSVAEIEQEADSEPVVPEPVTKPKGRKSAVEAE